MYKVEFESETDVPLPMDSVQLNQLGEEIEN